MWLAPTLGGGRNELNLKWGRSTIMAPEARWLVCSGRCSMVLYGYERNL